MKLFTNKEVESQDLYKTIVLLNENFRTSCQG